MPGLNSSWASCTHTGEGVPEDYREAMKWFRKAAEQEHASAQFNMGVMYHDGEGVPEDYREAMKWYRMAAEQGDVEAQYQLGGMYSLGEGIPEAYVKAYAWVNLAAAQGDEKAVKSSETGSGKQMTAEQVAEAQKLSGELYKRIESESSK